MSSLSSSASSASSSTPATASDTHFRPHASSASLGTSEAGPAYDKRTERRRSTLNGSDRKRRLVNLEGDVWSRRGGPGAAVMDAASSSRAMDSRPFPRGSSQTRLDSATPGSSYATAIDLSSSPPNSPPQRTSDRRSSWARPGTDYLDYVRPQWQPDIEVTECPICSSSFSFWYRKHHCRKCGRVVCASCSPHRITIPRQFIVRPPDYPASTSIAPPLPPPPPPHTAQIVDLLGGESIQSPAINPALGGGEEVRLCNPCVPDPNPEPPRGYTSLVSGGEQRSGTSWLQGTCIGPTNQSRHRSYHSLSTPSRQSYHGHDNSAVRSGRRTMGSSDYSTLASLGGSLGSRFHERPLEYGSMTASRFTPSLGASTQAFYPFTSGGTRASPSRPSYGSAPVERESHLSIPGSLRHRVDERDLCPICDNELPPLGENGSEDSREAHVRDCIENHGRPTRSPQGSPVTQPPPLPVRMLGYNATEKDCLGHDGAAQECTICMEEYEHCIFVECGDLSLISLDISSLEDRSHQDPTTPVILVRDNLRVTVSDRSSVADRPFCRLPELLSTLVPHPISLPKSPQLMEIDPRLRAGSDNNAAAGDATDASHAYTAPSVTRPSATIASSSLSSNDYPEPPSHFSAGEQLHSATTAAASNSVNYYNTSPSQAPSSHTLYEGDSAHGIDPNDPNDPYSDLKRPRACEACRQLKVRCEPDLNNPNGTCKRCAKARRSCVVTVPTRKRQKKTDSRVAELERKIDALTASLQASHRPDSLSQPALSQPPMQQVETPREEHVGRRWLGATHAGPKGPVAVPGSPIGFAGVKRQHSGEVKERKDTGFLGASQPRTSSPATEQVLDNPNRHWRGGPSTAPKPEPANESVDVIDRGLVSLEVASQAFDRFANHMAHLIPMVTFAPGTTMNDIRKVKPVLLHAIVTAAIGPFQPDLQITLANDFFKIIADKILVKGEKSLELVQAILVACNWYTPPDNFEELKFYQLSQLAITVGIDIGMYRKLTMRNKPFNLVKDLIIKKSPSQDPDSPEARRAWLGCYFISVQVASSLRRAILVRWNSYMDECVEILEKSPEALPSDKAMIHWAKLARIIEEINFQFLGDDASTNLSFSEPKFQYTLKVFEKQLDQWSRETRSEDYSPILKQAECIVNLYMHESALHVDSSLDDQKSPGEDHSSPTSAAHMNALSVCLTSIHQAIDTICDIDTKDLPSMPVVALARTSFAVVALIKLYSIIATPETSLGQVIEPSSLKVEYYLDKVIEHYSAAGEIAGGRTPAKFAVVLSMLRSWFMKRKDQGPALKEALGGGVPCGTAMSQDSSDHDEERNQQTKPGPTPLHLLSEVAMGDPQNRPNQMAPYPTRSGPDFTQSQSIQSSPSLVPHPQSLGPTPSPGPPTSATTTTESDPWAQYPRQFYPPFSSTYQDIPSSSGYHDPSGTSNMVMPGATQGFFVPELGMQVGVDSDNIFALESMLGYGLLNLPLPMEGGEMGYY